MYSVKATPWVAFLLLFAACWAEPTIATVPTPAGDHAVYPDLLSTEEGLYLLWTQDAGSESQLRMARYDGTAWTEPVTLAPLADAFINWADFPTLYRRADGGLLTFALPARAGAQLAYDIDLYQSADGGQHWTGPLRPHRDSVAAEHGFVSFFPVENGATGMVWLDGRNYAHSAQTSDDHHHEGANMLLQTATIDAQGRLQPDTTLDERVCSCCQTAAAALPDGGAIIAYRDRDTNEVRDISYLRRINGRWTEPRKLHDDNWTIAACPVNGPSLASRGAQVAAAWFTGADHQPRVYVSFSTDAGASFGAPRQLNRETAVGRVDLAWLDDDTVLVAYLEERDDAAVLMLQWVNADGQQGERVAVAPVSGGRGMGFPRLTIFQGQWYLAWTQDNEPERIQLWRGRLD